MNNFVTNKSARICGKEHSDRHVIKMILESSQQLSTALRLHGYNGDWVYKATHKNHPCTKWVAENIENFNWVLTLGFAYCEEYTYRTGKHHKSENILIRCDILCDRFIPRGELTVPPKAMPDEYKIGGDNWDDVVASYRNYYINGKTYMNKGKGPQWKYKPERCPQWFIDGKENALFV